MTTACLIFSFVLQLGPEGAEIASYIIGGLGLLNQALVEIARASGENDGIG